MTRKKKGMFVYTRCMALWLISVLLIGLYGTAAHATSAKVLQALPAAQQTPAPSFTLPDHRGIRVDSTDMQGKIVVVRFWATW